MPRPGFRQRRAGNDRKQPLPVFLPQEGALREHQSITGNMMRKLTPVALPQVFRSSFRDWTAERTDAPREVCEIALAHVNSDRVEAAYRRSGLFDRHP